MFSINTFIRNYKIVLYLCIGKTTTTNKQTNKKLQTVALENRPFASSVTKENVSLLHTPYHYHHHHHLHSTPSLATERLHVEK